MKRRFVKLVAALGLSLGVLGVLSPQASATNWQFWQNAGASGGWIYFDYTSDCHCWYQFNNYDGMNDAVTVILNDGSDTDGYMYVDWYHTGSAHTIYTGWYDFSNTWWNDKNSSHWWP